MPFTDPMADGPAIQLANQRALGNGMSLRKTLQMVREFRTDNDHTPIVLMAITTRSSITVWTTLCAMPKKLAWTA